MDNIQITSTPDGFSLGHIGWKYYSDIKKKAMDKEFSWSGLIISLSVAFFIVIAASYCLSLFNQSLERTNIKFFGNNNIYLLENFNNKENYINIELLSSDKLEIINSYHLI